MSIPDMPLRPSPWKRWSRWLLAAGLLVWLLRSIRPEELTPVLRRGLQAPGWLAAGFLATVLAYLTAWLRWHGLLKRLGLHWTMKDTFRISAGSITLGTVLPGTQGGDAYRGWWACRRAGHEHAGEALGSVVLDRVFGLGTAGVMAWAAALMYARHNGDSPLHEGGAWLGWAGLAGFLGFLFLVLGPAPKTASDSGRERGRLFRALSKTRGVLRTSGRDPAVWAGGIAMSFAVQSFRILACLAFGTALGVDLPASTYVMLVPLILMAGFVPLTPGGVGIRENLFVWMFGWEGVEPGTALCLSLLFSLSNIGVGILGLPFLARSPAETG